jgi:hypothetical protein
VGSGEARNVQLSKSNTSGPVVNGPLVVNRNRSPQRVGQPEGQVVLARRILFAAYSGRDLGRRTGGECKWAGSLLRQVRLFFSYMFFLFFPFSFLFFFAVFSFSRNMYKFKI